MFKIGKSIKTEDRMMVTRALKGMEVGGGTLMKMFLN